MIDYGLWLSAGLWLFFASNLLAPLPAGRGVVYLSNNQLLLKLPSWRSSFLGKRLTFLNPWHSLNPSAQFSVFQNTTQIPENRNNPDDLASACQLSRAIIIIVSLLLLVLVPLSLLIKPASNVHFLLAVLLSYSLYGFSVIHLLFAKNLWQRQWLRQHWQIILEPILCLPYAGQMLRKLYWKQAPLYSLSELLQAPLIITEDNLSELKKRIEELQEITVKPEQVQHLQALQQSIQTRQKQGNSYEHINDDCRRPSQLLVSELDTRRSQKAEKSRSKANRSGSRRGK